MVKNLPGIAGDESSILGQGTKIPHTSRQRSPHATMKFLCAAIKTRPSQINMCVYIYIYIMRVRMELGGGLPLIPCRITIACTLTPIQA